jgi:large subunit ribosomal protein L29
MAKKELLHELGVDDLRRRQAELADEIFRLRMKRATASLDNKMLIRNRRRDLARVLTILRQRTKGETR